MSSDDDLDADDLELPQVQDIQRIWDDERAAAGRDEDEDLDDMDNFIDYDEDEDGAGGMDEEEREERRRERRRLEKERRKALGSRPELTGIDAKYVQSLSPSSGCLLTLRPVHGMKFMKYSVTVMTMTGRWPTTRTISRRSRSNPT